jgi:hypothetical protein
MPPVGFESTVPVFEREETFHALDSTATVIGGSIYIFQVRNAFRCLGHKCRTPVIKLIIFRIEITEKLPRALYPMFKHSYLNNTAL